MSAFVFVIVGLLGLVAGGEMLVRGAVSAARSWGISPMVIGLTLVGFGTSTPELVTSLQAALSGASGIAIGNVVGGNIGNILLIIGVAAVLAPVAVDPAAFKRDGTVVALATLMCLGVVLWGQIDRLIGAGFVLCLAVYLIFTLWSERQSGGGPAAPVYEGAADTVPGPDMTVGRAIWLAVLGLIVTILGARFLVSGAVSIAQLLGMSETVIGLTIVAIGTSMPELVTAVIAVRKGQADVAFGNVIGSNIFNILGILGVTAIVQPMAIPPEIMRLDIWVLCFATVLLLVFARTGLTVSRREGGMCLLAYVIYLGVLVLG